MWRFKIGVKSDEGSLKGDGKLMLEEDLAWEAVTSLPWIPILLGTKRNLILKFAWKREKRMNLIHTCRIRGDILYNGYYHRNGYILDYCYKIFAYD